MGYDSFGLPAEQYAIQTGQHPAKTTTINTDRYREQLDKIGFSFDWSREVKTSNADYYHWTQWIFCQLFNAWYDKKLDKTRKIEELISTFEKEGNQHVQAVCDENTPVFTAEEWNSFSEKEQQQRLLNYRIAFLSEAEVNWCPALGTVLSNDEVKDGLSERGGHPVERKKMMQWSMRISAYAERLLQGLEKLDWSEAVKEIQRNWIGKSKGAEITFDVDGSEKKIKVFTTRLDTIFGVSFMVLAPESDLVQEITTPEQKIAIEAYIKKTAQRSERDRMADVKTVSGEFTGAYAIHPFSGKKIPIWIADYVLAGYGTGAVMAVPRHDSRDYAFATHFGLDKPQVVKPTNPQEDKQDEAIDTKAGTIINSDFLDGLDVSAAIQKAIEAIEAKGIGKGKINYKMRDAIFSRQRYWGEPIPVYYKDGVPYLIDESDLPLTLPDVDKYLPTEDGEPPLARATDWKYKGQYDYEHSTMPGWAGSSWYFFRYMDPQNDKAFASQDKLDYWGNVDLYMGGAEHATGHLLYARFWTKALYDLGYVKVDEPFQKMINQGMIQGEVSIFILMFI
jgi:leucyl-tRNA synthetase